MNMPQIKLRTHISSDCYHGRMVRRFSRSIIRIFKTKVG